jgi:hypothetical protein
MLTFRVRWFAALLGFSIFTLLYISIGVRWHIYRARASLYARQELEHTFEAADLARAARSLGNSDKDRATAATYRKYAEMHEKEAQECTRLRRLYEQCW